jgi:hypothetical protein
MRVVVGYLAAVAFLVVGSPAVCFAQFGAIAGLVRDDTGAVLPGVTVEAASPVLIEKTRAAVSDGAGQYKLEQLRPGVYSVTFTLPGFSTVRREGIELSAGFTAPVNAILKVGAVSETVTVTGEAPVVDVQSISQQKTLLKEELNALPAAMGFATLGTTLPGVQATQRDVGGSAGEHGNTLTAHGGASMDMSLQVDGVSISNITVVGTTSGSANSNFFLNDAAVQEMSFETAAISAESASGGVRVNAIPREGGNTFQGQLFGNFATRGMSMSNFTADLQARGLKAPAGFQKLWDESGGVGGPIRRDRVWFFFGHRYRGNDLIGTDAFFSKNPLSFVYDPDPSRPLHGGGYTLDNQVRVTAQATPRNKLSFFFDKVGRCECPSITTAPTITGESTTQLEYPEIYLGSMSWQATLSPKLIWNAAYSYNRQDFLFQPEPGAGITSTTPTSVLELSTGRTLRAPFAGQLTTGEQSHQNTLSTGLSYVTGSHSAKVGFTWRNGWRATTPYAYSNAIQYSLFNGVPQSVTLTTAPYTMTNNLDADVGIYAQDRWTLRRLTLTGGVRFDYFNASIPAQSAPASRWIGARSLDAIPDVPNWKDISPRLGAAYDLFGNGKTAIRGSVSRYVTAQVYFFTQNINPFVTTVNTATRTWSDNGDFIPQGDPLNPLPNGEFLGTINPNFGKSVITTRYDPAVSQGWGKRPYNWEYSASVQQELLPRVSLEVGYYRRTYGNQTVTDNLDVTPADYTPFCMTAPTDARLGNVSGSQVCGLYDISPAKAGLASNQIITFAKNYPGETSQTYDGVDVTVNARPSGRLFLQAGVSTGRTDTKNCALVDNPQTLRFCDVKQPFLGSYRVSGGYTFPWQVQLSGVFQSIPPDPVATIANYPARNADAAASLGRPIATPGGVINVSLVDPSTYTAFADRTNQVDLRLTKGVRVGRYRVDVMADFYNAFNVAPVLTYTSAYGPAWLTPASILQSGYLKLGGRFTF